MRSAGLRSISNERLLFSEGEVQLPGDTLFYERALENRGYRLIAGIDEAGRGPLAGPVVAAAVILRSDPELPGVRDSKTMTEKERDDAFPEILRSSLSAAVGVSSNAEIDDSDILKATLAAMKKAVLGLDPEPDFLLVDGLQTVSLSRPQRCLTKGDQRSLSISAASVIAKVYRDRVMRSYHELYPGYGFDRHKGYGTKEHLAAIRRLGPSPIHRNSFKGVRSLDKGETGSRTLW
ncbi:MAG: ribonuclease HII [Deltaproteobacteria bacterium CG_4_8_14_3_um_filter_51_11]|nr:ribonuclease HII [bacterium]NCP07825.1 ribonuclease HII [bacterium]PIP44739.1 MAG: ribonuclease HII [Deltaproteobacteria bacterium CG23_combo_of_CG06-09_8_20_14_all_51_20]PIX21111.1 MAG: ribonuclease HII [Deltaproteobacteria bacterium CG_4_8_14_3_um_filter_51_11]PIY26158.1 MAG: ribonuclease HII [Deltaproteobacteria bacterium CG_4_10_14_3_um_filter_51_14]